MAEDRLTQHFTYDELTGTEIRVLQESNRNFARPYLASLQFLCSSILEPLRTAFGPLHVHSGFRSPELNRVVGGSASSQHLRGEAADVNVAADLSDAKRKEMARWLAAQNISFHQALVEFGCLHVSLPVGQDDRQVAYAERNPANGLWIKKPLV